MTVHLRTNTRGLTSCEIATGTVTALPRNTTCPACLAVHTPELEARRVVGVQARETQLVQFCKAYSGEQFTWEA